MDIDDEAHPKIRESTLKWKCGVIGVIDHWAHGGVLCLPQPGRAGDRHGLADLPDLERGRCGLLIDLRHQTGQRLRLNPAASLTGADFASTCQYAPRLRCDVLGVKSDSIILRVIS